MTETKNPATRKAAYQRKMSAQLDEQKAKLDQATARARKTAAKGEIEAHGLLDEIEEKLEGAKRQLAKLADAGEDAWDDAKDGVENAWHDVKKGVERAVSRFS